jgi:hypothetical protein
MGAAGLARAWHVKLHGMLGLADQRVCPCIPQAVATDDDERSGTLLVPETPATPGPGSAAAALQQEAQQQHTPRAVVAPASTPAAQIAANVQQDMASGAAARSWWPHRARRKAWWQHSTQHKLQRWFGIDLFVTLVPDSYSQVGGASCDCTCGCTT